ncbi:MAG: HIT domain-containing protein [Halobacteria archaeon]|nr:HIT domain-containing protein [Halobacteria archaeon]
MERLFAPWRIEWVKRDGEEGKSTDGCVFCEFVEGDDRDNLVVARNERSYVVLNNYPYNPGHVMVVPHDHTGDYAALDDETLLDHGRLKAATFEAMRRAFDPDGFNTGLNLGTGSGGSIDDHLHTHVVPRWVGDTNFLPVTSDTKVIVEEIERSYDNLHEAFAGMDGAEVDGDDGAVRL